MDDFDLPADRRRPIGEPPVVELDVSWLVDVDFAAVDALARLMLVARRSGRSLRFHLEGERMLGAVELVGLAEVLRACDCTDSAS
jgi:ABC-type transporter Mla MlaB component